MRLDVSSAIINEESGPLVAAFVRDITERKRADEAPARRVSNDPKPSPGCARGHFPHGRPGSHHLCQPGVVYHLRAGRQRRRWAMAGSQPSIPTTGRGFGQGWREATSRQASSTSEYPFLHQDGIIAWVIGQAIQELDADGQVRRLRGYFQRHHRPKTGGARNSRAQRNSKAGSPNAPRSNALKTPIKNWKPSPTRSPTTCVHLCGPSTALPPSSPAATGPT